MKTKINEKGAYPKVCVDCEVELNPGVNVYLSMFNEVDTNVNPVRKNNQK
jgi:hypothetical protein